MNVETCTCNGCMAVSSPRWENFYRQQFIPNGWAMHYDTLSDRSDGVTLRMTGHCKTCHGYMEEQIVLPCDDGNVPLFEKIYEAMRCVHPFDKKDEHKGKAFYYGGCEERSAWYGRRDAITTFQRNRQFLNLFHDYDRPLARRWLAEYHPTQAHEEVLRDTGGELFCAVVQMAKENGDFSKVEAILDYTLPSKHESLATEHTELSSYEFDFVPVVNFGGSEGIYVDCYLKGQFDGSGRHSLCVGSLKTLDTDLDACKIMGELCGVLMYHANLYVNREIHRYTPDKQLLAEKQREDAK